MLVIFFKDFYGIFADLSNYRSSKIPESLISVKHPLKYITINVQVYKTAFLRYLKI